MATYNYNITVHLNEISEIMTLTLFTLIYAAYDEASESMRRI